MTTLGRALGSLGGDGGGGGKKPPPKSGNFSLFVCYFFSCGNYCLQPSNVNLVNTVFNT